MIDGLKVKIANTSTTLLYIVVVLLPWQARYFISEGRLNDTSWEYATLSIYIIDALILILLLTSIYTKDEKKIRKSSKLIISILAFSIYLFVILALSPFQNSSPTGALYITSALFLLISLILVSWERKKVFLAFLVAGLWSGVLGAFQFFNGDVTASTILGISAQNPFEPGVSVIESNGTRLLRAYGSLSHPNMLGGLLVISIFSSVALLSKYKDKIKRILLLSSLVFLTFFLFITFSRSAIFALILGLLVSGAFIFFKGAKFEKITLLKSLSVIFITLSIASVVFSDEVNSRFSNNRLEARSIDERVDSLVFAKEVFSDSPIFGTGFNTYTEAIAKKDTFAFPAWAYQPVHNVYLLLLTQLGVVGMLMLVLFFIYYLRDFFFHKFRGDRVYIFGMIICLGFISMFDHYLISSHFGILLSIIVFSQTKEN